MSPAVAMGAMSLGNLIDCLERHRPDLPLWVGSGRYRLAGLYSYRGYYEDLALGFDNERPLLVRDGLAMLRNALGTEYFGWKGGGYVAHRETGLWVSPAPDRAMGSAVVGIDRHPDGVELVVQQIDD